MPLPDSPHAVIPLVIREILAADTGLAAFFDRIAVVERRQLRGPLVRPSLLVVPGPLRQERVVGGEAECEYTVSVLAVLPPEGQWIPDLAALAAPTVTATGTGTLTGTYRYRVTQANADGESEAGAEQSVVAATNIVTVTRPALASGATCWRVWASGAGRTCLRWAATLPAATAAWIDDGTRRDDIAPIPFLAEDWLEEAEQALLANEVLESSGVRYATAAMALEVAGDEIIPTRNLRVRELVVKIPTLVDAATKRILTERV